MTTPAFEEFALSVAPASAPTAGGSRFLSLELPAGHGAWRASGAKGTDAASIPGCLGRLGRLPGLRQLISNFPQILSTKHTDCLHSGRIIKPSDGRDDSTRHRNRGRRNG